MNFGGISTLRFLMQHPLTARQPFAAVARYLRWQLGSRILGEPVVVNFVNDARLLVRCGMTGATGNVYAGLDEYDDMSFLLHVLRPGDLFVDVGANVGTYTVLAAKAVGAHVVAFEPVPRSASALRDNIALNAIESLVSVRLNCVGAAPGSVLMTTQNDTMNHVVEEAAGANGTLTVAVETLDDALADASPFLIKIDVEGYEFEVIRGASRVLARPSLHCVIMEIGGSTDKHERPYEELVAILAAHGFEPCRYSPVERRLDLRTARGADRNVLFVRDRALVRERVASAPRFRVLNQQL